jgi:hypothetical protein
MRYLPGTIIGYRKNGAPIRIQAGGSEPAPEPVVVPQLQTPGTATGPTPVIITPQAGQQYFTAEQLEAARKQEKDKLYARIEDADKRVADFQAEMEQWKADRQAEQDRLKAEQDAAAEAARKAEEDKLSVQELLAKRDSEWQAEKEALRQQMETERVIAQRDRELFQLQAFIQRRVAEEVAQDNIAPELIDLIDGNNEAEVEASITKMKEKTASIVAGMGGQRPPTTLTPGVSPAGFAPSGPLDNITGARTYTPEQIKAMNREEYAKFRAQVGIDKAGNNQGLFN